jgi:hypothetical protein
MTHEQVIEWANQCGFLGLDISEDALIGFARLAREDMREQCAKVCDHTANKKWAAFKHAPMDSPERGNVYVEGESDGATECAEAIRNLEV